MADAGWDDSLDDEVELHKIRQAIERLYSLRRDGAFTSTLQAIYDVLIEREKELHDRLAGR